MEYMNIRVSYSHSGFPDFTRQETKSGVSSTQTSMETTAMASLKRQNTQSLWSPPPTPTPNPLFQLIEKHWGPQKAGDAMQKILAERSTPRKPARSMSRPSLAGESDDEGELGTLRHAPSASKENTPSSVLVTRQKALAPDRTPVKAVRMPELNTPSTTKFRTPASMATESTATTGSGIATAGRPQSNLSQRPRLRNDPSESPLGGKRRSLGVEALRSLVPLFADLSLEGREKEPKRMLRGKARKRDSVWNWGAWL